MKLPLLDVLAERLQSTVGLCLLVSALVLCSASGIALAMGNSFFAARTPAISTSTPSMATASLKVVPEETEGRGVGVVIVKIPETVVAVSSGPSEHSSLTITSPEQPKHTIAPATAGGVPFTSFTLAA